ncbi:hypothetical protein J6590_070981 [Homalodisca vitripennis]|nr:hypothetical protein J6590_070981 [Homalodisca vitripennis]
MNGGVISPSNLGPRQSDVEAESPVDIRPICIDVCPRSDFQTLVIGYGTGYTNTNSVKQSEEALNVNLSGQGSTIDKCTLQAN